MMLYIDRDAHILVYIMNTASALALQLVGIRTTPPIRVIAHHHP